VLPNQDFELVYTVSQEDVSLNLLSYRDAPDDGFFLLLVAPSVEVDEAHAIPKDVLLVLDTSARWRATRSSRRAKRSSICWSTQQ